MKCNDSYKSLKYFLFLDSSSGQLLVLLIAVMLIAGKTPLLSQSNEAKSSNSGETSQNFELNLETLNKLHSQASNQLTGLTQNLNQASQELQASKTQLTRLQNLLDNALRKSSDLEATNQRIAEFNQQIGERMQERDTDLANAYDELDAQDKKILKMWIAIVALGAGSLVLIVFNIFKFFVKPHVL